MNALLRFCGLAVLLLAAGCEDKNMVPADAGEVADSGPAKPALGGKLGAAVEAAEAGQGRKPAGNGGSKDGPPENGIFPPGGADAALFSITSAGALRFNTAPDYDLPGDANGDNVYAVTLRVSDGSASANAVTRNWNRMSPRVAPAARRMPISGMRWVVFCQSTPNRPNATINSRNAAITAITISGAIDSRSIDERRSVSGEMR